MYSNVDGVKKINVLVLNKKLDNKKNNYDFYKLV